MAFAARAHPEPPYNRSPSILKITNAYLYFDIIHLYVLLKRLKLEDAMVMCYIMS